MIEIIYLDIDGTLRDEQYGIPESAVQAISQCRKQKIRIVICTGRNVGTIQDDVMALQADGVISGGGCRIQYHGAEIFKRHFSQQVLRKTLSVASEWKLSLAVETDQKIYMDHGASLFYKNDFQHKITGISNVNQKIVSMENKIAYEDNFEELRHRTPEAHKICIFGDKNAVGYAELELAKDTEVIQKRRWNDKWYLELLPKGCDKGSAVTALNHRLGIPKKNSMSFGDSENDISMMKATGAAVAVGGGSPDVRKYASSICEPVMEDGIYKELLRRKIMKPFRKGEV